MANFTREEIEDIVHKLERASLAGTNLSGADRYGESGTLTELYQAYQLDAKSILSACRSL